MVAKEINLVFIKSLFKAKGFNPEFLFFADLAFDPFLRGQQTPDSLKFSLEHDGLCGLQFSSSMDFNEKSVKKPNFFRRLQP